MGRASLTLLTAIAVLWHASVGCCAHHAHADGGPEHETTAGLSASEGSPCGGCCSHSHAPKPSASLNSSSGDVAFATTESSPHPAEPCCEEPDCRFAAADPSGEIVPPRSRELTLDGPIDFSLNVAAERLVATSCLSGGDAGPPIDAAPGLRRHAALRVWRL